MITRKDLAREALAAPVRPQPVSGFERFGHRVKLEQLSKAE